MTGLKDLSKVVSLLSNWRETPKATLLAAFGFALPHVIEDLRQNNALFEELAPAAMADLYMLLKYR